MKKYVKKPIVVEAMQLKFENFVPEIVDWIGESKNYPECKVLGIDPADGKVKIKTLEGVMICEINDWIIKGIKGEFYPCKPDVFEATYEVYDK